MDNNLTFHVSSRSRFGFATISSVQPKKKKKKDRKHFLPPPFIFIISSVSSNTRPSPREMKGKKKKLRNSQKKKKKKVRVKKNRRKRLVETFKTFAFNLTGPSYFHLKQTPTVIPLHPYNSFFHCVCV